MTVINMPCQTGLTPVSKKWSVVKIIAYIREDYIVLRTLSNARSRRAFSA
jgi:hypothetical protein